MNEIRISENFGEITGFTMTSEGQELRKYFLSIDFPEDEIDLIYEHLKANYPENSLIAFISNLEVKLAYQGMGLGKDLMRCFSDVSKSRGAIATALVINFDGDQRDGFSLVRFYKSLGFNETEWYFEYGLMIKES